MSTRLRDTVRDAVRRRATPRGEYAKRRAAATARLFADDRDAGE